MELFNVDNPGWGFSINTKFLKNYISDIEDRRINEIERSDADWIHLFIKENELQFACSEGNLIESFNLLFNYLKRFIGEDFIKYGNNDILERYKDWYIESCNEDWEHSAGTHLNVIDNRWVLKVYYYDLDYKYDKFLSDSKYNSSNDYYKYHLEDKAHGIEDEKVFAGEASINNLHKLFEGFVKNLSNIQ